MTEDEADTIAIGLNVKRRRLNLEQRKELALTLSQKGWTQERIADALGVVRTTVTMWFGENITDVKNDNGYIPKSHAKLSPEQKREIHARAKAGETQAQLAADFDVSQPAIHKAIKSVERREARAERILATSHPSS